MSIGDPAERNSFFSAVHGHDAVVTHNQRYTDIGFDDREAVFLPATEHCLVLRSVS